MPQDLLDAEAQKLFHARLMYLAALDYCELASIMECRLALSNILYVLDTYSREQAGTAPAIFAQKVQLLHGATEVVQILTQDIVMRFDVWPELNQASSEMIQHMLKFLAGRVKDLGKP